MKNHTMTYLITTDFQKEFIKQLQSQSLLRTLSWSPLLSLLLTAELLAQGPILGSLSVLILEVTSLSLRL